MEDKLMNNENHNQDKPSVFDYPVLGGLVTFCGIVIILSIPTAIVACILWLCGLKVGILQLICFSFGTVVLGGFSIWIGGSIILAFISVLIESIIEYRKDVKEWKERSER